MKKLPEGWPRISSSLYYDDARAAIDWLCNAFAFTVKILVDGEDGGVMHSELTYGEGLIMVSGEQKAERPESAYRKTPRSVGGANTQNMMVYVDDVEAHCQRARGAGAKIVSEPKTTDYGEGYWIDRGYEAEDCGGHHWWFVQRLGDSPKK